MAGDAPAIGIALKRLGLISTGPESPELRVVDPWRRGGVETYVCAFRVRSCGEARTYMLKAFVPYPGTLTVAEALAQYMRRAEIFRGAGVRTPRTYAWFRGTLLQEYIPEDLAHALQSAPHGRRRALVLSAVSQRMATEQLGFVPLKFFSDLRVDGFETVLVDLGQDLLACGSREYDAEQVLSDWKTWLWGELTFKPLRDELLGVARSVVIG
jgi:hypothetical protein